MTARRPGEDDDDRLIASALAGDDDAFARLLERHERMVLRVLRLLGVPPAEREDLAQDVFVRVFRHLGGFRRGRKFESWLYRIAVNVAHDWRARRRRERREEPGGEEGLESAEAPGAGPEGDLRRADLARALEGALSRLSERERSVFVLVELEGLSTLEVARALGIARITVRRHLGRARDRLRALLG